MIRIVDYGLGNIQAFLTVFKRLGITAGRAREAADLADATKLILPGVGAFDHAMELLDRSGLREPLEARVLDGKVPVLGVCVGMQMLANGSDEGRLPGLGWIRGRVRSFASNPHSTNLPLPHMGWNDVTFDAGNPLFRDFPASPRFYFLHSYYFDSEDKSHVAATANYGFRFDCIVSAENIHGVQCHPEKSHGFGSQLLKNFAEL